MNTCKVISLKCCLARYLRGRPAFLEDSADTRRQGSRVQAGTVGLWSSRDTVYKMLGAWLVLSLVLTAVCGDAVVSAPSSTPATLNSSVVQSEKPDVYSLHIRSVIQHRYASTVVSSRVANRANQSQEIFFSFVMPETAFISGFIMEIDGVAYKAHVREKEEAKREYTDAVSRGQTAAHVAQSARNSNRFTVSVNIEPLKKVTFNLTYEELLKRQLSFYTHAINIDPGQIVRDLSVEVHINESSPIKTLQVPVLRDSNEIYPQEYTEDPFAEIDVSSRNSATVHWAPTEEQQRTLKAEGIKGQLAVRYDLDRTTQQEQILVNEGYFVHFFSPEDLTPLPKHVVFVIDVSGSMWGRKIEQLRDALVRILSDLSPGDFFSFVTFSTNVKVWNPERPLAARHSDMYEVVPDEEIRGASVVPATSDNVNKAKEFAQRLETYSSTNIHGALMKGLQVAQLGRHITQGGPEPMVIFLTDGEANIGESDPDRIVATVSEGNSGRVAIFGLAFGDDANMSLLKKLSLKNSGFARKIYEASDAALQLQDFYRQVSSPLLANVTFQYTENQVEEESLSSTKFSTLFRGSELVVAGKLSSDNVSGVVTARGVNGSYTFDSSPMICLGPVGPQHNSTPSFMERLWGYLTIQQLLERQTAGSGNASVIREKALELALRYSFVTPLTSLVVTKPNETSSADVERGDTSRPALGSNVQSPLHYNPRTGGVILSQPSSISLQIRPMHLPGTGASGAGVSVGEASAPELYDDIAEEPGYVPPPPASLQIVALDRLTWLNRTTNSTTITLRDNPASPPDILLVKLTNETNEAYNVCATTLGGPGHCRHLVNCALNVFQAVFYSYLPFFCRINNYAGVCCPDSLLPVVAQS